MAWCLHSRPAFTRELEEGSGWSAGKAKFVGCVGAGVIAATLSHPMDTIKTCMQGDVARIKYGTLTETAKTLHAEGGMGAFFKGALSNTDATTAFKCLIVYFPDEKGSNQMHTRCAAATPSWWIDMLLSIVLIVCHETKICADKVVRILNLMTFCVWDAVHGTKQGGTGGLVG